VRSPAAATRASRRSSLAPATLNRSRRRSSCFGLIACTAKPRSSNASTTGPCGTSIATATAPASPAIDTSQSQSADKPAPPCGNARSPTTAPPRSRRQAWCCAEPQSTAANQLTVSSAMVLVLPCHASRHDACRNLYRRSEARLPTGHPSWPACRGTGPKLVLMARVHKGLLPAGRPARPAYTRTRRALPGYRCTNRLMAVGRRLSPSVRRCAATLACRAGSSG
jgi:hypothetical protein